MIDIVERLRSNEMLPICPYDRRSPEYWTAPNDKPCKFCGQENTAEGPDLCRGADTRIMGEAANEIERLRTERKILDKRIHNQRVALRENWEIIEMRATYKRAWYPSPLLRSMLMRSTRLPQTWWMKLLGVMPTRRPPSP